jgi:hypothetical protein
VDGLQVFHQKDLLNYLKHYGYKSDEIGHYWQNADGHVIYIPDQQVNLASRIFFLKADHNEPMSISFSAKSLVGDAWIDEQGVIRNLPAYARSENTNIVTQVDEQSGYFLQRMVNSNVYHVGSMRRGDGWLFNFQGTSEFTPSQVCGTDKSIYLLDDRDRANPAFMHVSKNCWAYSPDPKDPTKYIKVDEFRVPGRVDLVSPSGSEFICSGYGYMPFPGGPFVYDVEKHEIKHLPDCDDLLFFLSSDWLSPRLRGN